MTRLLTQRLLTQSLLTTLLTILVSASPASAHIGAPEGRAVFLDDDGNIIGAGSTWGVLERTAEGYLRTCEEAVGDTVHFYYWAKDREEVLVGTNDGVLTSSDQGCSWTPAGIEGKATTLMRTPRDQPGVLFVSTTTNGEENGVYRSIDDGLTWAITSLSLPDFSFTSLQVSDDGQTVVASGIDYTLSAPRIFLSVDGGATFAEQDLFDVDDTVTFINVVGMTSQNIALSALREGDRGSTLYLASLDLQTLGPGVAFDTDEANGVVTDYALYDGTEYVLVNRSSMHKRTAGTSDFFFDDDGPGRCLIKPRQSTRLWGCAQPFQLGHFLFVDAALDIWRPVVNYLEITERRCPEGTQGAERCQYLFPEDDAGPLVDSGTPAPTPAPGPEPGRDPEEPSPQPDPPPDCACSTTSSAPAPTLLLALFVIGGQLLRRRRRQTV